MLLLPDLCLKQVLKFNDIYMTWSSPKSDLKTNFLNLENGSFENVGNKILPTKT